MREEEEGDMEGSRCSQDGKINREVAGEFY